jgi:hypothetical protein
MSARHVRASGAGLTVMVGSPATSLPGSYIGFVTYDIDGNRMSPQETMYRNGSLSTLLSDFIPGVSTTLEVDNIDGWDFTLPQTYRRKLIPWDYVNGKGFLWPKHTYSRRWINSVWDANVVPSAIAGGFSIPVNIGTMTGMFSNASNPAIISAGTKVSQGDSGGTFKYSVATNDRFDQNGSDWVRKAGWIGGVDYTGTNLVYNFQPGTASVAVIFLPLWSNAYFEDEFRVSSIYMHIDASVSQQKGIQTNASSGNNGFYNILYRPQATSSGVTSVNASSPIIMNTF